MCVGGVGGNNLNYFSSTNQIELGIDFFFKVNCQR